MHLTAKASVVLVSQSRYFYFYIFIVIIHIFFLSIWSTGFVRSAVARLSFVLPYSHLFLSLVFVIKYIGKRHNCMARKRGRQQALTITSVSPNALLV